MGRPRQRFGRRLLAHDDVEIVVNLTIPAAHVEVALQAVAAGKHVWGEKPYALDRESGTRSVAAARRPGPAVAVAPDTFLGAGLQTGLRVVERGDIGTPLTGLTLFQAPGPESWHPSPEFLFAYGAGPMFDVGPYYLTTLVQVFGPVAKVTATASKARETRVIGSGPKAGTEFPVEVPTPRQRPSSSRAVPARRASSASTRSCRAGFVEIAGTEGTAVFPDPNDFEGDTSLHPAPTSRRSSRPRARPSPRGTGVADSPRRSARVAASAFPASSPSTFSTSWSRSPSPPNGTRRCSSRAPCRPPRPPTRAGTPRCRPWADPTRTPSTTAPHSSTRTLHPCTTSTTRK